MFGGMNGGWGHGRGCGPQGGGAGLVWDRMGRGGGRGRGGFGDDGDGAEGRGRGRRMFDGEELRLVLLRMIADEPRHGYDLIRAIGERTGGGYSPSPGVVYPSLAMLGELGLIEEVAAEGAKKRFAATDAGRRHVEERGEEVQALLQRLDRLGAEREAWNGSPVWRAVRNLGVAIRYRVARGDLSQETLHEAAALIDELAQKIERLK